MYTFQWGDNKQYILNDTVGVFTFLVLGVVVWESLTYFVRELTKHFLNRMSVRNFPRDFKSFQTDFEQYPPNLSGLRQQRLIFFCCSLFMFIEGQLGDFCSVLSFLLWVLLWNLTWEQPLSGTLLVARCKEKNTILSFILHSVPITLWVTKYVCVCGFPHTKQFCDTSWVCCGLT